MAWRHKRAEITGHGEYEIPTLPILGEDIKIGYETSPHPGDEIEPVLPSTAVARLSLRPLGSFRGRRIWESGLSLLRLH